MKLYLLGFMGCGKSHVGKRLAKRLHIPFIDLDDYIEKNEAQSISDIFEKKGENEFRKIERKVLQATKDLKHVIVGCGGGTPCFFDNMEWMNNNGTTFYLNYSVDTLFLRLKTRKEKRPLIKDMTDEKLYSFIQNKLKEREVFYLKATHNLQAEKDQKEAVDLLENLLEK